MALVTPVFIDTTVLVAGLIEFVADAPEQAVLDAVADGRLGAPQTAWHCCLEFFAVATRLPPEFRISPAEAVQLLQSEVLARFDVNHLPRRGMGHFLAGVQEDRVAGGRVYDAHIAEVARVGRAATVVTGNRRHFTALLRHGIYVLTPEELLDEIRA